jgi:hypothetical protein
MLNLTIFTRRTLRHNRYLAGLAALAVAFVALGALIPSAQGILWLGVQAILAYLTLWVLRALIFVDARIQALVGPTGHLPIHARMFPAYKWADLYRAGQALTAARQPAFELPAPDGLETLIRLRPRRWSDLGDLRIAPPITLARAISADDELLVPVAMCWCFEARPESGAAPVVIRVSYQGHIDKALVEVAAHTTEAAKAAMEDLTDWAGTYSIYRNKTLRVTFESGPQPRFGREDQGHGLALSFVAERQFDEDSIVLDDLTRGVLEHTVIDFHRRRAQLMALGLPGKRGVLFYGPPGTGKTYTSAYLGHRLYDATKIIAAGKSLLRMADICAVASSLQPALIILEDVDLVFSDRELAPNTALLGEFLDQLDGFASNDQIIFILTTNVLERVEAAIKDRPGRVSQCIYFGPPSADLRRRYLAAHTRAFNTEHVQFERIVAQTDGASQAFLKELVLRAVQIASAPPETNGHIALTEAHFETALREMTAVGGKLGRRIIGFQVEDR